MSIPLRWRLLDEQTGSPLTECSDIDGLFVDRSFPAEPLYERYTLLNCAPAGPLLAAIDGTGPAWFGNFLVEGAHLPGRPVSESCAPGCKGCFDILEELLDVHVVGHRPAADGSGLLDIDLDGHRRDDDNNSDGTVAPDVFGYRLIAWTAADGPHHEETPAGECRDIAGLFRLIWHDSEVARTHLVSGYDRKSWLPAVTFDDLVHQLSRDGVQLELR